MRLLGDDRLARLAAAGSRDAFASIYTRHHQGVYRYCRSILGSSEDAADALQSTMANALVALEGESRDIALKPWLYRIAHNEAINLARRRRPQDSADRLEDVPGPPLEATAGDRERLRQLFADLGELSERQRGALLMRELSGLSYAELAAGLGISAGAAKQTVFEGRSALQELAEGRAMSCDAIRRSISDRDRRALRGRRLRAHVRECVSCRDFRDLIDARRGELQALAPPLPMAAAAAILDGLLGAGGGGGGLSQAAAGGNALAAGGGASTSTAGGLAAWLPGTGALGASAAGKGLAAVAATLAIGAGAAGVATQTEGERTAGRSTAPDSGAGETVPRPATSDDHGPDVTRDRDATEPRSGGEREGQGESGRGDAAEEAPGPPASSGAEPGPPRRTRPGGEGQQPPGAAPAPNYQPGGGAPGSAPDDFSSAPEQYTDGRMPEQGGESPAAQAPTGTPAPTPPAPTTDMPGGNSVPEFPALPPTGGR